MIGSTRQQPQQSLGAEAGALVQQREAEAQQRGGDAAGDRQPQAVPEHTAIIPVGKAAERPDVLDRQPLDQRADGEAARPDRSPLPAAPWRPGRTRTARSRRRPSGSTRPGTDRRAWRRGAQSRRPAAAGTPMPADQRAGAQAFLRRHGAEGGFQAGQAPALDADEEALQEQVDEAERAAGDDQQRGRRWWPNNAGSGRSKARNSGHSQPRSKFERLQQSRRTAPRPGSRRASRTTRTRLRSRTRAAGTSPTAAAISSAMTVRSWRVGVAMRRIAEPAANRSPPVASFGRYCAPISLSQRLSRRLRSSEEPYLAKS